MDSSKSKGLSIGIGIALTAAGSVAIPKFSKKAADKALKKTAGSRVSKINFDDMGPEIVKKDKSDLSGD